MALPRLQLFEMTSWDHLPVADLPDVDGWDGSAVSMVAGQDGTGQAVNAPSLNFNFGDDDFDLVVARVWFKPTLLSTERSILQVREATFDEIALKLTTGGFLKVETGGSSSDGPWVSSAHAALMVDTWYQIEFGVYVNDTEGRFRVKLDGVLVSDLSVDDVDTHGASTGITGRLSLINPDGQYDDLYLYLGNGQLQDSDLLSDQLGNPKVATLYPTGQGAHTAWGNGFAEIDETIADGDTSRIEAIGPSSDGDRESWTFQPIGPAPETSPDPPEGPSDPLPNPSGLFLANLWDDRFEVKPVQEQGKYLYDNPTAAPPNATLLESGRLQMKLVVESPFVDIVSTPIRTELGLWDPNKASKSFLRDPVNSERWYATRIEIPSNWEQSIHKTVIFQHHHGDAAQTGPVFQVQIVNDELRFILRIGGTRTLLATVAGVVGRTHDFVMHAIWRKDNQGIIRFWHQGNLIFTHQGQTLPSDETEGVFFHMGIYLPGAKVNTFPDGFTRINVLQYLLIGDTAASGSTNGNGTGETEDSETAPQSTPGGILGVQTVYQMRCSPTNNATARAFVRVGGVDVNAQTRSLITAYEYRTAMWPRNPLTNEGWLASELNTSEAGVQRGIDQGLDVFLSQGIVHALFLDDAIPDPLILTPGGLLDQRTHHLATLWRIQRAADGFILRFTDHNAALIFDGELYEPAGGLEGTARRREANFRDTNMMVRGILKSDVISAADLRAGRYNDSLVVEFLVDWRYPWAGAVERRVYRVQEIGTNGREFTAELGGIATSLRRQVGDVYSRVCRYRLGDNRCTVPLADFTSVGLVVDTVISDRIFTATAAGLSPSPPDDWFAFGELRWTRGENAHLRTDIQSYVAASRQFTLQTPAPCPIASGDHFDAEAGCDHLFDGDCGNKFDNKINFGGFPYLPGLDKMLQTPDRPS